MNESRIFPLTSGEGYGAVIHKNFVTIRIGFRGFCASVSAFLSSANYQFQNFDNMADVVAWAIAAAETHQGKGRGNSRIDYSEIHNGYSIIIEPVESGEYRA